MNEEVKEYLLDILDSCNAIKKYYKKGTALLSVDRKTKRAVERELEIIGQAVYLINKIDPSIDIYEKNKIIRLRYKLFYSYFEIDTGLIYRYTTKDIYFLIGSVESLLNNE